MTTEIEEKSITNTTKNYIQPSDRFESPLAPVQMDNIGQFLFKQKKQIEAALPKHLTADRMLRILMTEIKKNPKIKECTPQSLVGSIMQCSQLGLEPGNTLGHAYLIPFNKQCQFMIGYRGMIDLARRSAQVLSLAIRAVYSKDRFEYSYGLNEKCEHVPAIGDRGDFVGAYVIVKMRDGSYYFEFLSKAEIDKIRDKSVSYSTWVKYGQKGEAPIWVVHYEEMAKKTVMRHVFKYLPISIEIQTAVGLDEEVDRGNQNNSFIFDNDTIENQPVMSKADDLANKLTA